MARSYARITKGDRCFIVAEIGQNHNGDVTAAKALIDMAADCGADAVKFQIRDVEAGLTKAACERPYDMPHSYGATYGEHRQWLELSETAHVDLKAHAELRGLIWFTTACDLPSLEMAERLGNPICKVASRDADNGPLLEAIAKTGKPIILSTGMSTLEEIGQGLEMLGEARQRTTLLHCVSEYPTPVELCNLRMLDTLRQKFRRPVGWSDHTAGLSVAVAAAVMGACVIEKHITLDRAGKGTDHAASLERTGLLALVGRIRTAERAIGDGETKAECRAARRKLGRSLVTARKIPAGTIVTPEMVCLKSPGNGIRWGDRHKVIGKRARHDLPADSLILHGECIKTVAVIQARMGSTRLPGKVLEEIDGYPMLEWVCVGASRASLVDEVVVATIDDEANRPIVEWCQNHGISVIFGGETDILGRTLLVAESHDADFVVRIPSDNPMIDPEGLDAIIRDIQRGGAEYVSHRLPDGTPAICAKTGRHGEVMTIEALRRIASEYHDTIDREHVTRPFYAHPERHACRWLPLETAEPHLSVDTPEDLQRVRDYVCRNH